MPGVVVVGQAFGGRRQRARGAAECVEGGAVGGHVRGDRAVVEGVEGVVLGVGGADQFPLPLQHVGAVALQTAHAVGVAPEPPGALAGLGGTGNSDRFDIGGIGGGQPGPGFPDFGICGDEAVEVDDAGIATVVRVAAVTVVATNRERIDLAQQCVVPRVGSVADLVGGVEGAQGALGGVQDPFGGPEHLLAAAGALEPGDGAVDGVEGALLGAGHLRGGALGGQQDGGSKRHGGDHHNPNTRHHRLPAPSQITMFTMLMSAPSLHQSPISTLPDPNRIGAGAVP